MHHAFSLALQHDQDVVTARQRAAQLAQTLAFDLSEQTRIATAVSEIVRNAFRYSGEGLVDFFVDGEARPQRLVIRVADKGRGIPHLDDVLSGQYQSTTGMGIGIQGARRLMDRFSIESSPKGTTVVLEKFLPARGPLMTEERLRHVSETLANAGSRPAWSKKSSGRIRICCAPSTNCSASSRNSCTSTGSSRTRIEASSRSTPSSMKRRITSDELTS